MRVFVLTGVSNICITRVAFFCLSMLKIYENVATERVRRVQESAEEHNAEEYGGAQKSTEEHG